MKNFLADLSRGPLRGEIYENTVGPQAAATRLIAKIGALAVSNFAWLHSIFTNFSAPLNMKKLIFFYTLANDFYLLLQDSDMK